MKNFYLDKKNINEYCFNVKLIKLKTCNYFRFDESFVRRTLEKILFKMFQEDHLLPEKGDIIHISGVDGLEEKFSFNCKQIADVNIKVYFDDIYNNDVNIGHTYYIYLTFEIE